MRNMILVCSTTVLVCCSGCDRGPSLVPVEGRVTYNGKPVVPGAIFFEPTEGAAGSQMRASSLLQIDGSYTLRSYPHGDGAVPGDYRVYLQLGHGNQELSKLTDSTHSPLAATIPEAGRKDLDFELLSRKSDKSH